MTKYYYTVDPADIYMLKVNKRSTRTRCEICSKFNNNHTKTTPGVVLISLLLTLNIFHILSYVFFC